MFKKGYIPWNAGTSKTKVSIVCENCGKTVEKFLCGRNKVRFCSNKCAHEYMGAWNKGKKLSNTHKENLRLAHLGKKQSKEHIRKRLRRRDKSSLEIAFENIIKKLNLPFKFVGNGDFILENKCPDFININGEKIAIEVFYRDHKNKTRENGLEKWKEERLKIFNDNGWELIFFNETEVKEDVIKEKLKMEVL